MRVPLWLCLAAVAGLAAVVRGTDGVAGCLLIYTPAVCEAAKVFVYFVRHQEAMHSVNKGALGAGKQTDIL